MFLKTGVMGFFLLGIVHLDAGEVSCPRTLLQMVEGHSRLVYHSENSPLYSPSELERLIQIFNIGSAGNPGLREANSGKAIQLINPIYISAFLEIKKKRIGQWRIVTNNLSDHKRHNLGAADFALFFKFGLKVLQRLRIYDPVFYSELAGKKFYINFFGVRYFPRRGQTLKGVWWHQHTDSARYQGIILLQKPKDLIGGAFLLAPSWIEKKIHKFPNDGGYSVEPEFHVDHDKEIRFDLATNRLLTFDGLYSAHATESFALPSNREEETGIRDILGIEIGFPEK